MPTWADFIETAKNRNLVRKSSDAVVLKAPMTAAIPASILTGTSLSIPPAYLPFGWHTDDGLQWAREIEKSEITGHGSPDPIRTDVTRVNNTLEVTFEETNIHTLGLAHGIEIAPTAGTANEVVLVESSRPRTLYHRLLAVDVDDTDFGEIYFGRLYPRASVDAQTLGAWANGDEAKSYGATFRAEKPAPGELVTTYIGGPGFTGLREAMGFDAVVTP